MRRRKAAKPEENAAGGRPARSASRLVAHFLGHGALVCLRGMLGRRFAATLLVAAIAMELTVLCVGVMGKLDHAYQMEIELAKMHLSAIEAQALGDEMQPTSGSAGIGATPDATAPGAQESDDASDDAPLLRPRDVATIVAQEAGGSLDDAGADDASADGAGGDATDPGERVGDDGLVETPSSSSGGDAAKLADGEDSSPLPPDTPLSDEDAKELDSLIRKGVSALTAGDMRLCVLSFERAIAISPNHPALLYYYGMAYDKLLNPNKAREYYMRLFRLRDRAGKYFQRASRRLTYGFEQPAAMRGKLAFGPQNVRHTYDDEEGERVSILLPVLLAPGEEVKPDDIYVTFQAFDLVNGRKIEFARLAKPQMSWQNATPTWQDSEEDLFIEYAVPPLTREEIDAYGDLKYYGFTAKLYYKGEPLDCISSPSALILQEQRLLSRRANSSSGGLLPDDGLDSEEATPASDFLNELDSSVP